MENKTNIEDYNDWNCLHRFTKKHSPMAIEILEEKKGDWFVNVVRYKKRSGIISTDSMMTRNDIDGCLIAIKSMMNFEKIKT